MFRAIAIVAVLFVITHSGATANALNYALSGVAITPVVSSQQLGEQHLGLNVWRGTQVLLPLTIEEDQLFVSHGDALGNRQCHALIVQPGQTIELSGATWQAYLISGSTPEERLALAQKHIADAEAWHGFSCPLVEQ